MFENIDIAGDEVVCALKHILNSNDPLVGTATSGDPYDIVTAEGNPIEGDSLVAQCDFLKITAEGMVGAVRSDA